MPMINPPKPQPGDRVAIVSPAAGLPGLFPLPYELGLHRLKTEFGLEPVEYPTTRKMGATSRERAADLHEAFAEPTIRAVIATIGGDDQITVLPHLDTELITANPKPFFGHSDNTNLLLWLRNRGIVGFSGGSVMVHFGRPGAMHPTSADSLRAALFTPGPYRLTESFAYGDKDVPWEEPGTFGTEPVLEASGGWIWHQPDHVAEGRSWGGNLEILSWLMMADKEIKAPEHYEGDILFFETSEEMPTDVEVYRILRNMGERGLLQRFAGVLVGRAKSWFFTNQDTDRATYTTAQRQAVLKAFTEYAPDTMIVFDVDLGHTDPQVVIPVGGTIRIDGPRRTITVTY
ncbi:muramoyltetrapeptide carboxypeptidase LdcA involved in peptidoglycan recycling [Lentzea atacamensis]|uniref:Muramoyltetrapeptide carboxypeptidase LdcA involved in peptidoglycan recycling n=1 Tax=Lentzea atacamensis TaxID=531938 RepID=A0A316I3X8_9PSEU|nr:S66 peptidase family protein [Lentzea atacamensis]PWK87364.1 muramoyltetrapeptide carboxypeptidase LdcA involved in peptidoglycan recycling [Lentzea atacamensis]